LKYLLGLIGHPVSHSLSPPMHEAALSHFGFDGSYELFDVDYTQLQDQIETLMSSRYSGFNVTVPYKDAFFSMCQESTRQATACGAVNTVKIEDGRFLGHNTDVAGCKLALQSFCGSDKLNGANVAVIGAGGAARAALLALDELEPECVSLFARNPQKAQAMLSTVQLENSHERLSISSLPDHSIAKPIHVIIQTTPIGLPGMTEPPAWLSRFVQSGTRQLFFDMVYSPDGKPTPLVDYFSQRGLGAVDGTDMLIHQARLAFEFWTGKLPPFDLLQSALEKARAQRRL
jgi:shikimate dehydrogenase